MMPRETTFISRMQRRGHQNRPSTVVLSAHTCNPCKEQSAEARAAIVVECCIPVGARCSRAKAKQVLSRRIRFTFT